MIVLVNIGGSVGIVDATDPHHIDISVAIHNGGVLTVTATSPTGKNRDHARFVDAVNRIRS